MTMLAHIYATGLRFALRSVAILAQVTLGWLGLVTHFSLVQIGLNLGGAPPFPPFNPFVYTYPPLLPYNPVAPCSSLYSDLLQPLHSAGLGRTQLGEVTWRGVNL